MDATEFEQLIIEQINKAHYYTDRTEEFKVDGLPFTVRVKLEHDELSDGVSNFGEFTGKPDAAVYGNRETGQLLGPGDDVPDLPEGWFDWDWTAVYDEDYPLYFFDLAERTLWRDTDEFETPVLDIEFALPGDFTRTWTYTGTAETKRYNSYIEEENDIPARIFIKHGDGRKVRTYVKQLTGYLEQLRAWMENHTPEGEKVLGEVSYRKERNEYKYFVPECEDEYAIKAWEIAEKYVRGHISDYGVVVEILDEDGEEIAERSTWGIAIEWGDNEDEYIREAARECLAEAMYSEIFRNDAAAVINQYVWDQMSDSEKLAQLRHKVAGGAA